MFTVGHCSYLVRKTTSEFRDSVLAVVHAERRVHRFVLRGAKTSLFLLTRVLPDYVGDNKPKMFVFNSFRQPLESGLRKSPSRRAFFSYYAHAMLLVTFSSRNEQNCRLSLKQTMATNTEGNAVKT